MLATESEANECAAQRVLADTQKSLATALARVEGHRCRERFLYRENQVLRDALLQNGVSPAELEELIRLPPTAGQDVGEPQLRQSSTAAADAFRKDPLSVGRPVHYVTHDGKVPGSVFVTDSAIEFVRRVAHIGASEYLGVRALPQASPAGEAGGPTWSQRTRQNASAGAGVLSGTAAWLLQRVRRSSSAGGGVQDSADGSSRTSSDSAFMLPSISDMVRTILQPGEEDESASISGEEEPETAAVAAAEQTASREALIDRESEPESWRTWEVLWKAGGGEGRLQRLTFEGPDATRAALQQHMSQALELDPLSMACSDAKQSSIKGGGPAAQPSPALQHSYASNAAGELLAQELLLQGMLAEPQHLLPTAFLPSLSEPSAILTDTQVKGLVSALPARHQLCQWLLHYSSARHGISLRTLYRRSLAGPCLLIVRDTGGYVFGCFTPVPWKPSPRYYGTGETFVFQLQPHMVFWGWKRSKGHRNDYFMLSAPQSVALGGGGHFALFLDGELLHGTSGTSETFGNPCLASTEDFAIGKVELWGLGSSG